MKKYKESVYLNCIRMENVLAFFHSLNMELLLIKQEGNTKNTLESLCEKDSELKNICIEKGFLVEDDFDYDTYANQITSRYELGNISFEVFKMVITTECNLCCKYCLIEQNLNNRKVNTSKLDLNTAQKLLDFFIKSCSNSKKAPRTLMLYGGEPLCNKDVLKYVITTARKAEKDGLLNGSLEIILETNGTLVDQETARFLKLNNVFVIVSIDGLPEIHDYYRKYHDGSGSWNDSVRGYNLLREANVKVVISSVFTQKFAERSEESIRYIVREFNPESIGLNLYHVIEDNNITDDHTIEMLPKYLEAWEIARQEGLYIEHIMRRIRPLIRKSIRVADCQACGHRLVSDEKGRIGICEGYMGCENYFKKRTSPRELYNDKIFQDWAKRTPIKMKQCQGCIAQGVCGGGCVYNGIVIGTGLYSPDPYICEASKQIVNWAIKQWTKNEIMSGHLKNTKWYWLDDARREKILGNIAIEPFIPLQTMSKRPELNVKK